MVALELHRRFRSAGITATLAVGWKTSSEPGVVAIRHEPYRSPWARIIRPGRRPGILGTLWRAAASPGRYTARVIGREDFGFPATSHVDELAPRKPQLLHLHNLHGGYFDIRALPGLTRRYPTVYSPHDPWLLTGHCAHPITCDRWRTGCGACPDLDRYVPIARDASRMNWSIKRAALADSRIYLCSPSRWMMDLFLASDLEGSFIETRIIPNGVDATIFSPADMHAARARLGLPNVDTVIVTSARSTTANDFKGADVLSMALELASAELAKRGHSGAPTRVMTLGDTAPRRVIGNFSIESVPHTADRSRISDYLRAADLYVHPSRAENYPLTVLEALACGTPVIASDAGGTPEVVAGNEGAATFPSGDAPALAGLLVTLLHDRHCLLDLASRARAAAPHCYTLDQQAQAYMEWYASIIDEHSDRLAVRDLRDT